MDVTAILTQLKQQRTALDTAIRALERSGNGTERKGVGRKGARRKHVMSPEGRARIAAAARKRWAAARKQGKTTLAK